MTRWLNILPVVWLHRSVAVRELNSNPLIGPTSVLATLQRYRGACVRVSIDPTSQFMMQLQLVERPRAVQRR